MNNPVADSLNNIPSDHVANAAFNIVSQMQTDERPGLHIATYAVLFLLACSRWQVNPQDAFTVAKNLMVNADNRLVPHFKAILQYMQEEL